MTSAPPMLRNRFYYGIKPWLPFGVRMRIRRRLAVRLRARARDFWPIEPGSEKPPEGWRGWPKGKQFGVVLTHDVEGQAGLDKVERLMEVEAGLGFRSSFNLIPEGRYRATPELRERIRANGFEVGVHDLYHDGKLFLTRKEFNRRSVHINRYLREWGAAGFRSGFMLHNLDWLHALDIQYDASTFDTDPFEPQPQGRHTIFPFWVPRAEPPGAGGGGRSAGRGYVELPYTLPQDSTLFLLLQERRPEIWLQKLDWVAAHGGMALVNVHPDYVRFPGEQESAFTYPVEAYRRLLEYLRERYSETYWQPLPEELARWHSEEARRGDVDVNSPGAPGHLDRRREALQGRQVAVVLYSGFPSDPRPRRELEALLSQGMSVDLICLSEDREEPREESRGQLRVTRFPIRHKREGKLRYLWQYARFFLRAFGVLALRSVRERYALVHVHNMPDFLVFSALVPRVLGARLILDLHDPMPELYETIFKLRHGSPMVNFLVWLEKLSIRFADLILTPNRAFRDLFCSRGCPPGKIQIIMNTPDEQIFGGRGEPSMAGPGASTRRGFHIMYHGLIAERHGLATAVEALARVRKRVPNVTLDIYGGRNAYMDEITLKAERCGLNGCVRYHGKKKIDEIPPLILQADIGIIPNRRTPFTEVNFPTRIFEYLSLGKPVIVPSTKGIRDYFNDEQILFFKPDDADDLARKIEWAYSHPGELRTLVRAGRRVYDEHRWQIERGQFLRLTEALLAPDRERAAAGVEH